MRMRSSLRPRPRRRCSSGSRSQRGRRGATSAVAIALTLTIVEMIVRREARSGFAPRLELVIGLFRWEPEDLRARRRRRLRGNAPAHVPTDPRDLLAFLEHWLAERSRHDACHPSPAAGKPHRRGPRRHVQPCHRNRRFDSSPGPLSRKALQMSRFESGPLFVERGFASSREDSRSGWRLTRVYRGCCREGRRL
jgi:hypothetical protein